MLRITTDENAKSLVLRLEGRLHGAWVDVLSQSWDAALAKLAGRKLRVDLDGVTFVDAEGKKKLAEMHAQGAELCGDDLEIKAIVAEIRGESAGEGAGVAGNGQARHESQDDSVASATEELASLLRLQDELHAVNEELARSGLPLTQGVELNDEQKQRIGAEIRAGLARWEGLTQRIAHVLGIEREKTNGSRKAAKAQRNEH